MSKASSNPVDTYARKVVRGDVPAGKYHRLACERHLKDRAREQTRAFPYVFVWEKAERFLKFARQLKHYKGRQFAGQPFEPTEFQVFRLGSIFGWRHVQTGYRRFTTAYTEEPRKQGKSFEEAVVAVYVTFFEGEPGSEGYCIATKEKQARIAFDAAKKLVKSSGLSSRIKVNAANLHRVETESKLEPLGSDSDTTDGLNPNFIGVDELHAFKTRGLLDVMESATGARVNPLNFQITTAGNDPVSPCGDQHDYACKILDGVLEDDPSTLSFFACIAHADSAHTASYESSPALLQMVQLCSCERRKSAALQMGLRPATLTGSTTRETCATRVTADGSELATLNTRSDAVRKAGRGRSGTPSAINQISSGGIATTQTVESEAVGAPTCDQSSASQSSTTNNCFQPSAENAGSAPFVAIGSPSTIVTQRDESGDCFVSSATLGSATSETVRLEYERHSPTCAVRQLGKFENGRLVIAHPDDDPWSEETWKKANPHWGISVEPDDMRRLAAKAQKMPSAAAEFKQKRLGLWVNANAAWLSLDGWRKGQSAWQESDLHGQPCWAGVDLSSKIDLTAIALAFPPTATRPQWRVILRAFTPEDTLVERAHRDRAPYGVWREQGWLTATPGRSIDHDLVLAELVVLRKLFKIQAIGFDPYNAENLERDLQQDAGFGENQVIEIPQTFQFMSPPSKDVEADVLEERIDARENPLFAWAVSNAVVQKDGKDNIQPIKKRSRGRIDPVVALIIARAVHKRLGVTERKPRGGAKIWTPSGFKPVGGEVRASA